MRFNKLLELGQSFVRWNVAKRTAGGMPELTQVRYGVKRGNYATLEDKDIARFESIVGTKHMLQEDLDAFNIDFQRSARGSSKLVLKPGNVQEVSSILRYCNERKLAICPIGGNTGLVGGSVPVCDEIVVSMQRLNKVVSMDEVTGIVVCEAGVILENLDEKARSAGLIVPLDLGAKSSCQLGGNVSTNAGGIRLLRYGSLQGSVLGLEVVLANGQILDLMSHYKKDNTGYHLKHLFIGSEGTLGLVTKLSMLCPPNPKAVHLAFLGLPSFEDVLKTFMNSKRFLGEILSSCEFIDARSLDSSVRMLKTKAPVEGHPYYMVIETSGSNSDHDMEKFNSFLEHGMEQGHISDGTLTAEVGKMQELWKLRELIAVALRVDGYCFKYDISLPLHEFYKIVEVLRERLGNQAKHVCGYGHLGDCNLHLTVVAEEYSPELHKLIEPFVYEYVAKVKGSISAEHGIGFFKSKYLNYSKSPEAIQMMKDMKKLLDPSGILNPYKVLS